MIKLKVNNKNARLVILSLCVLLINEIRAQQYQPLPLSDAVWDIVWYKDPEGWIGDNPFLLHYKYRIIKDSIIDNKTYQVYNKTSYNTTCSFDSLVEPGVFFLRNDINTKRVYLLEGNEEKELYNFNLNVGDTLNGILFSNHPDIHFTVNSIDSVIVLNTYHKRFVLYRDGYFHRDYLIEGVGYSWGLLENAPTGFYPFYELRCFHNNNQLGYMNSFSGECALEVDTCLVQAFQPHSNWNFNIYPNPANAYCIIHLPKTTYDLELSILNLLGKPVLYLKPQSSFELLNLDVSKFPTGIYLLIIKTPNQTFTGKLVVQH